MKQSRYVVVTILFLCLGLATKAQEVVLISKSEILDKVSENNKSIKISEAEFNSSQAEYIQTNAVFLPDITVSHTGISTTNPLMAFGSKLNQETLTQNDFSPILLNDPVATQNFSTKFEIKQPLINIDGILERKAVKSRMEAMALQTKRNTDYVVFTVEKAYMQLQLVYKSVEVLKKVLEAANANKKLADDRFNQGLLQRADVLLVEVRVTEIKNQLQSAKSSLKNASNYISFLMDENAFVIYQPSETLTLEVINIETEYILPENRADIKAMQLTSNAYESMSKADKMSFLPRLNAFGSYELYDDTVFQGSANGYIIGAQLNWNLFEGSKRIGKIQKSKAEYERSQLKYEQYLSLSQLELNKAQRKLTEAVNSLQLSELALEQSKEALRIRTNRFKEGLEKTSDLLQAETQFAQKQLGYFQTIFEYNHALAYLQFLTKE